VTCEDESKWNIFYRKMKEVSQRATNAAFLSMEVLARWPENVQAIRKLQSLQELFNVKVIAVYRRHPEWFLSLYHQWRKTCMWDSSTGRYRNFNETEGNVMKFTFPPPTISEFSAYFRDTSMGGCCTRDTLDAVEFFGRVFGKANIYVGDLHASSGLERNFFCDAIPGAFPTTCDKVVEQQQEKTKRVQNKDLAGKLNFDEDLLVSKAYHLGYLHEGTKYATRRIASLRVKKILDEEGRDKIPKLCKEISIDSLWNRTLYMEQRFSSNPMPREQLRAYVESKKAQLCNIDADALLNQTRWQNLFSSCEFDYEGCK